VTTSFAQKLFGAMADTTFRPMIRTSRQIPLADRIVKASCCAHPTDSRLFTRMPGIVGLSRTGNMQALRRTLTEGVIAGGA
jgi:hypothetical protein